MACVVCQHCQNLISKNVTVRGGCSYHKECYKCYVCSETNLTNAEVFRGVIFCFGCSKRIFKGCATARKTKNKRPKSSPIKKRGANLHQEKEYDKGRSKRHRHINNVLEQTCLTATTDSDSSRTQKKQSNSRTRLKNQSHKLDMQINKEETKDIKQYSKEIGMTTEVTLELLRQMNCPVIEDRKYACKSPGIKSPPKEKGDIKYNKTVVYSDLRIAELGASTEIAHMALRKKSEVPVIMRTDVKEIRSVSSSCLQNDSDDSGDGDEVWLESACAAKHGFQQSWLDRRVGSILKMPYNFFKKNIINQSSFISVHEEDNHCAIANRIKCLFQHEITEHQRRGVKRLYSTINRLRTPYKLGWLDYVPKEPLASSPPNGEVEKNTQEEKQRPKICKHFERSHSYRCMRTQVMRLAGPTKSELAIIRNKMKKVFTPINLIRDLASSSNRSPAILSPPSCDTNHLHDTTQR